MRPSDRPLRIFLTGASGRLGGLVGPALLESGASVRALVHRAKPRWIPEGPAVESWPGDLLDPRTLRGAADGCDVLIHAATRTGFGALDRARRRRMTVEGTAAVLAEAESAGVSTFLLVGDTATVQERGESTPVDEETPPSAEYASPGVRAMMEAEVLTLEANRPGSIRTLVVAPGVLLGPGLDTPLSGLMTLYLRQELPYRILEDVWLAIAGPRDLPAAVQAAIARGRGGRRYFACGESVRLGALYELVHRRSGVPPPRRRLPDLLVEELGLLTPVLPAHSFLKKLILPRELVFHLRRLAPVRNERTRAELDFVPQPLDEIVEGIVREWEALPERRGGGRDH